LLIQHQEDDFGFSPEAYEIIDPLLKEICREALKIYYPTNNPNSLDADILSFFGGDGDSVGINSTTSQHLRTRPAINVDYFEGKGKKKSPITVNEKQVNLIEITGKKANTAYQNGDLRTGNTITITNVKLSPFQAEINNYKELSIGKHYEEIQVVSSTSPSPDSPPPPAFFPEEVCQEIRKFGLRPLEISNDALSYFQEEFFTKLNEELALESPINREISDYNERIRQRKLSIKKVLKRVGVGENKNNISNASTLKAARNIAEERIREALKKKNVKPE
ncbi:1862_t:CDS:2, partial [Paraglomus occultum]